MRLPTKARLANGFSVRGLPAPRADGRSSRRKPLISFPRRGPAPLSKGSRVSERGRRGRVAEVVAPLAPCGAQRHETPTSASSNCARSRGRCPGLLSRRTERKARQALRIFAGRPVASPRAPRSASAPGRARRPRTKAHAAPVKRRGQSGSCGHRKKRGHPKKMRHPPSGARRRASRLAAPSMHQNQVHTDSQTSRNKLNSHEHIQYIGVLTKVRMRRASRVAATRCEPRKIAASHADTYMSHPSCCLCMVCALTDVKLPFLCWVDAVTPSRLAP